MDGSGEFTRTAKITLLAVLFMIGMLIGLCGCSWGMNGQWLLDREVREVPREKGQS